MQQLEFQACKRPFGIYQSLAQRGLLPLSTRQIMRCQRNDAEAAKDAVRHYYCVGINDILSITPEE